MTELISPKLRFKPTTPIKKKPWKFKDTTLPAKVIQLLIDNKISGKNLLVICFIHSMLRSERGSCFASNKYIGRAINLCPNNVSLSISKLKRLNLVIDFYVDSNRYLELEWSRTKEERSLLTGKYGEECRKALAALESRIITSQPPLSSDTEHVSYEDYLKTEHWQRVRSEALTRAEYKCQLCFADNFLHVHHKTYERQWNELPNDITVLCDTCHAKFHDKLPQYPQNEG